MTDHSHMKLGKRAPLFHPRRLQFSKYIASLGTAPVTVNNSKGFTDWGMLLNDQLGDCTIAAILHAVQAWRLSLYATLMSVPDAAARTYYEKWCGYNPSNPQSDQGGDEVNVLDQWHQSTLTINGIGHNLKAYVDPDQGNLDHIRWSLALFGGCYIGLQLPYSAQTQDTWDVVDGWEGAAGSWGGHAVFALDCDVTTITCITWGGLKQMTLAFWAKYCDEAHTLMSDTDWDQPNGVNYALLQQDLSLVAT